MDKDKKYIIILCGPDASGKSTLNKHIQDISNGKCHTIHSNFNKGLPKENHKRQHKLIAKFVAKQFSKNYYTGNNFVILDRCYFSDIAYGQIGYGSKGDLSHKFKYLDKLFKILIKNKDVNVFFIYCKPKTTNFNPNEKDELLNYKENDKIVTIYDCTVQDYRFHDILNRYGINFVQYDYMFDPKYILFDRIFCD